MINSPEGVEKVRGRVMINSPKGVEQVRGRGVINSPKRVEQVGGEMGVGGGGVRDEKNSPNGMEQVGGKSCDKLTKKSGTGHGEELS